MQEFCGYKKFIKCFVNRLLPINEEPAYDQLDAHYNSPIRPISKDMGIPELNQSGLTSS